MARIRGQHGLPREGAIPVPSTYCAGNFAHGLQATRSRQRSFSADKVRRGSLTGSPFESRSTCLIWSLPRPRRRVRAVAPDLLLFKSRPNHSCSCEPTAIYSCSSARISSDEILPLVSVLEATCGRAGSEPRDSLLPVLPREFPSRALASCTFGEHSRSTLHVREKLSVEMPSDAREVQLIRSCTALGGFDNSSCA